MAYIAAQARQELLDSVAEATDAIGTALAALGGAYDLLDERTGDRLEAELFRPVQTAYGRAQRTHAAFAQRVGLPTRTFVAPGPGAASHGVKGFVDLALAAVDRADVTLAVLQDSMRPVEVGDAELRAGLAEVRGLLGDLRARARAFTRTLGR
jgi:hypothetical protein